MTIAHDDARSSPEDLYSATLRFTALFNFSQNPAISFPAGLSSSGLPIGMQLVGSHLDEGLLLKAVHAFQKSTDWHGCHPVDLRGAVPLFAEIRRLIDKETQRRAAAAGRKS